MAGGDLSETLHYLLCIRQRRVGRGGSEETEEWEAGKKEEERERGGGRYRMADERMNDTGSWVKT